MVSFTPRFLDEIRARIMLSELIGRKVKVTRAGREFKACCPFHKEKTPSFTINDDKGFYHCFGCGAHGDVIGWTMEYENRSFPEAIEQLAAQAGLEMPRQNPQDIQKAKEQKNLYQLMNDAASFLEDELRNIKHKTAYDYILSRGLSEETLSSFRVGFASEDRSALYNHLKNQGYDDKQMIETGLIRKDKNGNPYSFFRDRIMFPVSDKRGRIVAFGGRILPDHLRAPDRGDFTPPKYINSIDNPLFHKGRMLYGAAHANYAARDGAPLIVTEGYMDVIACWQSGFRGAVAPLGTALTEDQIIELWRMIPEETKVPVLCFDGDNAGRRAAMRAAERALPLLKPGHSLNFVFLPDGEDPDTFLRQKSEQAFEALLKAAMPLVEFLFQQETADKDLSTPEERASLNAKLEQYTQRIPDRDVQYYYSRAFREKTAAHFRTPFVPRGVKNYKNKSEPANTPLQKPNQSLNNMVERILLAAVIKHPEIFHDVEERLGSLPLSHPALENIRNALFSALDSEIKLDFSDLKSHLISVGLEGDLSYTLNDSVLTHAGFIKDLEEPFEIIQNWDMYWGFIEEQKSKLKS